MFQAGYEPDRSTLESLILNLEWKPDTWTLISVALSVEVQELPVEIQE